MELSENLFSAFQLQYNTELGNSDVYQNIQNWAEGLAWDGFAKYFQKAAKEELDHAEAFRTFLIDRNRTPKILPRTGQVAEPKEPIEMIGLAYEAEKANTVKLLTLYTACVNEKDFEATVFLHPYLTEQRSAERELFDILQTLRRAGSNAAILLIDEKVGE